MLVQEFHEGGATILALSGRLDSTTSAAADEALAACVSANQVIVIDLAELSYISSAGLRSLLRAAKQAQAAKRSFAVAALQPPVRQVFRSSGLDTVLSVHDSRADAIGNPR